MPSLLVRLPNHLGDACMSLPALNRLAANGFDLTLCGRAWIGELFAAYPWRCVPLRGSWLQRIDRLRVTRIGQSIRDGLLLTNSFSTALEFRLAGLQATGYATDGRGWLLRRAIARPANWRTDLHMVEYYLHLANQLTQAQEPAPEQIDLRLPEAAHEQAGALLKAAGVQPPYVMLSPVAVGLHKGKVKAWSGFGRLGEWLLARGARVVVCPGPGEHSAVLRVLPRATILPEADLATFGALLRGSALVVANDSGTGHLAAAVGARLISVFGVTDARKTRPWSPRAQRLGGADAWPSYEEVEAAVEAALVAG